MRPPTFSRPGTLEWHDVPAPQRETADALVRLVAVAACDLGQASLDPKGLARRPRSSR